MLKNVDLDVRGGEILADGSPRAIFRDQAHDRLKTFLSRLQPLELEARS